MGLVSLLSVSKTFRAAKDVPHRYRRPAGRLLPKFESPARAQKAETPMKTQSEQRANKLALPKPGAPKAGGDEAAPKPATAAAASASPGANPKPTSSTAGAGRVVTGGRARSAEPWWNPARWFSWERWAGKRSLFAPLALAGRSEPRTPVQQELALENIKPCRNDLSDADWELAPDGPVQEPGPGTLKSRAGQRLAEAARGAAAPAAGLRV